MRALVLLLAAATAQAQVPLPEMGGPVEDGGHLLEFTAGGALVALDVDAATAGDEPAETVDSSTEIHWINGLGATAKLTVETVCPGQRFGLSVGLQVTTWSDGTEATVEPAVDLVDGMLPADLLRDVPPTAGAQEGRALLTYRASATVADGTSAEVGDDFHTVTFTFLDQ
ncbi:hypothetical protein [Rubrivirga sp.]|uniref:hypothetical protein n=1 Tax=Rubrivirga sp. TaxID=1885344 RepID=UPI003B519591